jgi:Zn-dependent M28 family amino/carboxypeptidase
LNTIPLLATVATLLVAAQSALAQSSPAALKAAEASIDPAKISAHVRFLSDDQLEGRYPGLRGGELAAKYIATQFAIDGLKPAGDNGTYFQNINFVGMKAKADETTMAIAAGPANLAGNVGFSLKYGEDYVVFNPSLTAAVDIDAPIVFVGYGATAPEFHWNDYAGIDVKGKVIVCIVGDPPSDDPKFFGGKALTYYGRWTYKFEQAARMGAVGALIIHKTELASYGWAVVKNSNTSEKTFLRDDKNPKLKAASWIQLDVAKKLFAAAGLDFDQQFAAAGKPGFQPIELPVRLNNGAADNGTGVGMILELARAWSALNKNLGPAGLPHSVLFSAVTAEEQGLLGSEYLGQNPPIPVDQIALDINYDMVLPIGVPLETNVNGAQRTSFFPVVQKTAKEFNLAIVPDPRPEAGSYYRSDHFSLSRVGIPAFSIETGSLYQGHDRAWGVAKFQDFEDHDYHNFTDNFRPDWDFAGNARLMRFGMDLGWQVITSPTPITWNKGDEFEAARLASQKH